MTRAMLRAAIAAILTASPLAALAAPVAPTVAEAKLIEAELSSAMPFVDRLLTEDVLVGREADGMRFVCGNVLTPSEDPARPNRTPFMGNFLPTKSGQTVFLLMTIAKPDPASKAAVSTACTARL